MGDRGEWSPGPSLATAVLSVRSTRKKEFLRDSLRAMHSHHKQPAKGPCCQTLSARAKGRGAKHTNAQQQTVLVLEVACFVHQFCSWEFTCHGREIDPLSNSKPVGEGGGTFGETTAWVFLNTTWSLTPRRSVTAENTAQKSKIFLRTKIWVTFGGGKCDL